MPPAKGSAVKGTAFSILGAISVSHLLNDMIQSLIPAIYPILQADFHLSFVQIGMITLTYQLTASLLQPLIGYYTDKHPQPYSLPIGMGFTLSGLLLLSVASTFRWCCWRRRWWAPPHRCSTGIFARGAHGLRRPARRRRSRCSGRRQLRQLARPAAGGADHRALRQGNVARFSLAALLAIVVLLQVSKWYQHQHRATKGQPKSPSLLKPLPKRTVAYSLGILLVLIFSKYFYLASISSYYTFYLIHKFGISVQNAQIHLFAFLFAVAAGTIIGGLSATR